MYSRRKFTALIYLVVYSFQNSTKEQQSDSLGANPSRRVVYLGLILQLTSLSSLKLGITIARRCASKAG
jgi:hypothetical protein